MNTAKRARSGIIAGLVAAFAVAGCTGGPSLPSLSTGSVAPTAPGDNIQAAAEAQAKAQAEARGTPTTRAFQVGSTSARAVKCGYNFDPSRLKQQFLAAEATTGASVEEIGKVEKIYDISFNGIGRGIAEKEDYCSQAKSKEIKTDLTRHLAGDYTPRAQKVAAKQDGGMFSGFFDGGDDVESGPKMGSQEWWEKQQGKMGR
ncbi:MAG: hypothetical protein KDJ37_07100 [Hyphomicrobiaceae bacterium]|nr:hypothetical protein [Hyphomicrobiaceae bacterium]